MNIGIFTDTYRPEINGVVSSIESYRAQFEARGHNVFIFAPSQNRNFIEQSESKIWRLPSLGFYGYDQTRIVLPASKKIKRRLAEIDLDIIHTQTPALVGWLGIRLGEKKGIPLVQTYHTLLEAYLHYAHLPHFILKRVAVGVSRKFSNRHDLNICPSAGMKRILEGYGVTKPIAVLPTGANTKRIKNILEMNMEVPPKYQLGPKSPFLVTAGRLGKEKNFKFLLLAMRSLVRVFPHLKLVIAGDGPERKSLEKEAESLGIETNVVFTGFITQEELFTLYRAARAFIFASLTETQGLVLLEALACGTPAVSIKAIGVEDMLAGDRGGFLTPPDIKIFCSKIELLLKDERIYLSKKAGALGQAEKLSIDSTAVQLLSLYEKTIESKKPGLVSKMLQSGL